MSNILIMAPLPVAAIAASRGAAVPNLLTPSPKEIWADSEAGTPAEVYLDLGSVQQIDTVFLGHVNAAAGATWTMLAGVAGYSESTVFAGQAVRAVDAAGQAPPTSHALHVGAPFNARYLRIVLTQPAGAAPLVAGLVMTGKAFRPVLNQEWGAGRRVIDTGTATPLPDGGFATVLGGRKGSYVFTLGDLSDAEIDALYALQLSVGETRPLLIVEDPDRTTGQFHRIHYGLLRSLRQFERRTPGRTRWELTIEQWV